MNDPRFGAQRENGYFSGYLIIYDAPVRQFLQQPEQIDQQEHHKQSNNPKNMESSIVPNTIQKNTEGLKVHLWGYIATIFILDILCAITFFIPSSSYKIELTLIANLLIVLHWMCRIKLVRYFLFKMRDMAIVITPVLDTPSSFGYLENNVSEVIESIEPLREMESGNPNI
jgi:hypothetical protein